MENGLTYALSGIKTRIQEGDIFLVAGEGQYKTVSIFRPATESYMMPMMVFPSRHLDVIAAGMMFWGLIKPSGIYKKRFNVGRAYRVI